MQSPSAAAPGSSVSACASACGIAQGLAFGLALPVVPVVTLLAMAHACRAVSGASDVLAILDARMGEVYWAQYRYVDGWQEVIAPTLSPPAAVTPQGQVTACGNGVAAYAAGFSHAAFAADARPLIMPRAEQVGLLARVAFAQGRTLHARDAQPLYLRNKVALTTLERQTNAKAAA